MDSRHTPEQVELRRTARRLARELGPHSVTDLDDTKRRERLAEAVRTAGWLELRDAGDQGTPLASGVEAAILAEALGEAVADVAFTGPLLAADLARRAGVRDGSRALVGFTPELIDVAVAAGGSTATEVIAPDAPRHGRVSVYVLVAEGSGYRLAGAESEEASECADLARPLRRIPAGARLAPVAEASRVLTREDLDAFSALGLALTSADLVGVMRGVLDASVAHARERKQYGVPVGSFQAVQHLLAEAHTLLEGASSAALYPAWAVDELDAVEARMAGRVAKAYAARAARTVCETAVQVHGGMGNTWDCLVHVYLRRALLSSGWFGDAGEMLRQLQRTRLGAADGLS